MAISQKEEKVKSAQDMGISIVTDEQAAEFYSKIADLKTFDLEGVRIYYGDHTKIGFSIVVTPAFGSSAILSNPFDSQDVF